MELGRVFKRSGTDDAGLALHQTRDGVLCPDTARICQRDGVAAEIIGNKLALPGALDHIFVGDEELSETKILGSFDSGNDQTAASIGFGHVNGDTQVDIRGVNGNRFALHFVVVNILAGELFQRCDHGPGDQVGEGYFPATCTA